jgi:hypothetical protein
MFCGVVKTDDSGGCYNERLFWHQFCMRSLHLSVDFK